MDARKLFKQGVRAFKAGNYPVALSHFTASHNLQPKTIVLYNIAMCHRALFRYTRSITAFRQYLKLKGRRIKARKKKKIEKMIPEMETKLGHLTLVVSPAGTSVTIDGEPAGVTPLPGSITMDPGTRMLELSCAGYTPVRRPVTVGDGQRIALSISLRKISQPGFLHLSTRAKGAQATVDGGPPRSLPHSFKLLEGPHDVRITAPGHRPKEVTVTVLGGKLVTQEVLLVPLPLPRIARRPPPRRPDLRLTPPRRHPEPITKTRPVAKPFYERAWFWTLVSAVVVGAGATTGYFIWQAQQPDRSYNESLQLR